MLKENRLYKCFRAFAEGKKIYYVPALRVMCFADSMEQCKRKFSKHRVERPLRWMRACYVLFGYMSNKRVNKS